MEEQLRKEIQDAGYDGNNFIANLKTSVESRKRKGICDRRNRYIHYCHWAHALKRKNIGSVTDVYQYPDSVLSLIRMLCPCDIKGEIREDAYRVPMEEFCSAVLQ